MKNLLYIMMLGCVSTVVHAKWVEVRPSDGKVPTSLRKLYVFDKDTIYGLRNDFQDILYKWNNGKWESLQVNLPKGIKRRSGVGASVLYDGTFYLAGYEESGNLYIYEWNKEWKSPLVLENESVNNFIALDHHDFFIIRPELTSSDNEVASFFRGDGKQWKQFLLKIPGELYSFIIDSNKDIWYTRRDKPAKQLYIIKWSPLHSESRMVPNIDYVDSFVVRNKEQIWIIDLYGKVYHLNGVTGQLTLKNDSKRFSDISVGNDGTMWGLVKKEGSDDPFNNYVVEWQE